MDVSAALLPLCLFSASLTAVAMQKYVSLSMENNKKGEKNQITNLIIWFRCVEAEEYLNVALHGPHRDGVWHVHEYNLFMNIKIYVCVSA